MYNFKQFLLPSLGHILVKFHQSITIVWCYGRQDFMLVRSWSIFRTLRWWSIISNRLRLNSWLTHKFKGINHFSWEWWPFVHSGLRWLDSLSLNITGRRETREARTGPGPVRTGLWGSWTWNFLDRCRKGSLVFCEGVRDYWTQACLAFYTLWCCLGVTEGEKNEEKVLRIYQQLGPDIETN